MRTRTRTQIVSLVLAVTSIFALATGILRLRAQSQGGVLQQPATKTSQKRDVRDEIKEKAGKPTAIQEGVMTEKQRKHSKLFKHFELATGGRKLRDMVAEQRDIYLMETVGDGMMTKGFDLNNYLTTLTCRANAVFLGTVTAKSSQLLDEGTFVFTDYEIAVYEVLKNDPESFIKPNEIITYTAPGGAVETKGIIISAVDYRSFPLQIGHKYLFYTSFVSETSSYKGLSRALDADTFEIKDHVVAQASEKPLPLGQGSTDLDQFMGAVRMALYQTCPK